MANMTAILFKNGKNFWVVIPLERFGTFMAYSPFSLFLLFLKPSGSQALGLSYPIPLLRLGRFSVYLEERFSEI